MDKRNHVWLWGLLGFAAIVAVCIKAAPEKISAKIKQDVDQVFADNEVQANYEIDGRDVVFVGDVSVNYNRTAQFNLAREVLGVRNIIDNQELYTPAPANGQILIENSEVRFSGGFKNPATLQLITDLIYKYFPDYKIIIGASVSDRMIEMQQVLDYDYLLSRFVGNEVWFEFSDRQVVMNGRFRSQRDRDLAEQKILSQINRQTRYINDIKITEVEESERIFFKKENNVLSVVGVVPTQSAKSTLISLFKGYYPKRKLELNVSVNGKLEQADWHSKITYLIPEIDRISQGEFKFYLQEIVLEGEVESKSTKAALVSRISEALESSEIIDRLVVNER